MRIHIIQAVFFSTSQPESCDVTVAFTFCLFKYSQRCSARLTSGDCEGKAHKYVSTLCSSLDFKQTWRSVTACLGPLSCWKMNPFSTQFQARRDGMPLKNRVVLLFGQCVVHPVRVTPSWKGKTSPHLNISTTIFDCRLYVLCINLACGARSAWPCFGWKWLHLWKSLRCGLYRHCTKIQFRCILELRYFWIIQPWTAFVTSLQSNQSYFTN